MMKLQCMDTPKQPGLVYSFGIAFDGLQFDLMLTMCRFSFHNFRRFHRKLSQNKI
jgi:hypothetical protein